METLAYTHLAAISEEAIDVAIASNLRNFLNLFNKNSLTRTGCLGWLSLGLVLAILSSANSAIAVQRGDTGQSVSCVQQRLRDFGYFNGPLTGYYGSLTATAVTRFQQRYGLRADGIAGAATLSKLGCSTHSNSGNNCFSGKLARGARGQAVSDLQKDLKAIGFFDGPITGFFGSMTESALIGFQRYYGLPVDGIAGPATLQALRRHQGGDGPISRGNLSRGSRGQAVTDLQLSLRSLGFYHGPITGYFGSLTEDAVIRFQRYYGISTDGIVGSRTRNTLESVASGFPSNHRDTIAVR